VPPSDEPQGHGRGGLEEERFGQGVDQVFGPRSRLCLVRSVSDPQELPGIIRPADEEAALLVLHPA
jgi:hypothetical protein